MAMTQAESYEPFWAAHRDNWRACTPADVWGLREDRTFEPPSLGHRKTLGRDRPTVTRAEPLREAGLDSSGARADVNRRNRMGGEVLAACGIPRKPHTTIPRDDALRAVRAMTTR